MDQNINPLLLDEDTGVYTRRAFLHYANQFIQEHLDANCSLVIIFILHYGHLTQQKSEVVNLKLHNMSVRLRCELPEDTIIGRFALDQFICLVPNGKQSVTIADYERISKIMTQTARSTTKVGVFDQLDPQMSLILPIQCILSSLASIQHQYGQYVVIANQEILARMQRRSLLEEEMSEALSNGQFEVCFQPKHNALSGRLVGAEALLRWNHPKFGNIPPSEFIPLFEDTGFVLESDAFVWRQSCKYLRKWLDVGLDVVPISANSSRADFLSEAYTSQLIPVVKEHGLPPHLLHIEVTESLFSEFSDGAVNTLQKCRDEGIQIELDDFGTGYSSLHSLSVLPIDIVKFDRSFVLRIDDPKETEVMRCCVSLIKRLNLKSVAEGVETDQQRNRVIELGIDTIQGYYYSRPLSVADFESYLYRRKFGV